MNSRSEKTIVLMLLLFIVLLVLSAVARANDSAILTIAYEARGESLHGQIEVAAVIRNRMAAMNKTPEQVVFARNQFSCWNQDGRATQKHVITGKEYQRATQAWHESAEVDSRATFYKVSTHRSPWFSKSVKSGVLKKLYEVGAHTFYKQVK